MQNLQVLYAKAKAPLYDQDRDADEDRCTSLFKEKSERIVAAFLFHRGTKGVGSGVLRTE